MFCFGVLIFVFYICGSGGSIVPPVVSSEILSLIPKLELHAHLHGSVRKSTFVELAQGLSIAGEKVSLDDNDNGKWERPFELFPLLHQVVQSKEVLRRILQEMIEDYEQQNTVYLEIRSTPRSLADGTSVQEYLETLLDIIYQHNILFLEKKSSLLVKLVVSVDRSRTLSDAYQTLELISSSYATWKGMKIIVGIDFSGNPLGGKFMDFVKVFEAARNKHHLNVTVHASEVKDLVEKTSYSSGSEVFQEIDETEFILNFKPDRLGHMLFIKPHHYEQLGTFLQDQKSSLPPLIEVCPTTAFYLLGLSSYANHPHIRKLMAMQYPISLHTDDSGIMSTTLTKEIEHMQIAIELSLEELLSMQIASIRYAFITDEERELVWKQFQAKLSTLFPSPETVSEKLIPSKYLTAIQTLSWKEYLDQRINGNEDELDRSAIYTM